MIHVFFIFDSFGQNGYQDGFIITHAGDTVYGEVRKHSRSKYYRLCEFKTNGQISRYEPQEIKGYGITDDRLFSSEVINENFVEVLLLSEMSLFRLGEQFLIRKGKQLYELKPPKKSKVYVRDNNAPGEKYKVDKSWLHTLSFLAGDCGVQSQDRLESMHYNQKDLTKFAVWYNTCKNAEIYVPKGNKPWYKVSVGLTSGIVYNEIRMHDFHHFYQPHLSNSYQSIDPFFGLQVAIAAPRSFNRLSLQFETRVFKSSFQGFAEDTLGIPINKDFHSASFSFTTISVPISIKYSIPDGDNVFFLQLGGNYDFLVSKDSERRSEYIKDGLVETLQEPAFAMRNNVVGIWTGVGYVKKFGKFSLGASARYNYIFNMIAHTWDIDQQIKSSGNRISFSFTIQRP